MLDVGLLAAGGFAGEGVEDGEVAAEGVLVGLYDEEEEENTSQ